MNKTYSKNELKAKALKIFEQYPSADQVYATVDGNVFLMKNRAELHSKDKITTFDRPLQSAAADDSKKEKVVKISAENAIKSIAETTDLTVLEDFAADKRATVKAAYETKKEELIKALEVNK